MDNDEFFNKNFTYGDLGAVDTDHKRYRDRVFIQVMENIETKFTNMYRFEGDDDFTLAKQRLFLKTWFRYGFAGVTNTKKLIMKNLSNSGIQMITSLGYLGVDTEKLINIDNEKLLVVQVTPNLTGSDDRMVKGIGVSGWRNNVTPRSYNITNEDTAYAVFNSNWRSGWMIFFPMAYMYASGDLVLKKRLGILDITLANNKVNNTHRNIKYEDIYRLEKSFLEMAPSQQSIDKTNNEAIGVTDMLDQKIAKLDFSSGEKVMEIFSFIKEHRKTWYKELGVRVDQDIDNGGEGSIQEDYDKDEMHYSLMENEYKDQLELFCEDYKRIFGKEIKLIDKVAEKQEEIRAKQVALAGHQDNAIISDEGEKQPKKKGKK